jgi:hypothetical protein
LPESGSVRPTAVSRACRPAFTSFSTKVTVPVKSPSSGGRAGQGGAVAEELLADLVGVVAAVGAGGVAAVDDREVAAAQVGDGGLVGGAVVGDSSLRWPSMGLPLASYSRM